MHCDIEPQSTDWMKAGDFESCVAGMSEVSASDPFAEPAAAAGPLGLSPAARSILDGLRDLYVQRMGAGERNWRLTDEGQRALMDKNS